MDNVLQCDHHWVEYTEEESSRGVGQHLDQCYGYSCSDCNINNSCWYATKTITYEKCSICGIRKDGR